MLANRVQRFYDEPAAVRRDLAPTQAQRSALAERRREIEIGLTPCDRLHAAEMILKMFDAWPTTRMDTAKARSVGAVYVAAVGSFPEWAIQAAVQDCQRRPTAFAPSAGELAAACRDRVEKLVDEAGRIDLVLNAEVFEPTCKGDAAKRRVADVAARKSFRLPRASDHRDRSDLVAEATLQGLNYTDHSFAVSSELQQSRPFRSRDVSL